MNDLFTNRADLVHKFNSLIQWFIYMMHYMRHLYYYNTFV